jgi:WD40 repeat protein
LLGVATPSDLIQDTRTTPKIQNPKSEVDRHCEELFLTSGARAKDDNLLFVRERLLRSAADPASLLELYRRVRDGRRVAVDDTNPLVDLLRLSGVARVVDGRLQVRNRIYERVFDRAWVTQHMPDAELRRQRAAYRRGLLRATAVAAAIVGVVVGLAAAAIHNARELRRNLYAADMNLAYQALELVAAYAPRPHEEDLRGWEWRYLWQQTRDASQQTGRGHTDEVVDLTFTADGRQLVSASHDSTIRIWDARSLRETAVLRRPGSGIHSWVLGVALTPNGRSLVSVGRDGRAEAWDLASRRVTRSWAAEESRPDVSMALAADGRTVVTAGHGEGVRLWDRTTGKRKGSLTQADGRVVLSPDGRTLATQDPSRPGAVRLLDLTSGRTRALLHGLSDPLAFGPHGRLLAARGSSQILEIWDVAANRERLAIPTPVGVGPELYRCAAFSPDGRLLAFASGSTLRLWDLARKRELTRLRGHETLIEALAFSPDGTAVATASRDGAVKLWDVTAAREEDRFEGVFPLASFSPDGRLLAASSLKRIEVWDLQAGRCGKPYEGQRGWVDRIMHSPVAFAPNGAWLAAGSGGGRVNVWDAVSRRKHASFSVGQGIATTVDFSPDGRFLAAAIRHQRYTDPGYVRIWELPGGREVKTLPFAKDAYMAFFSPGGRILVTQSRGEPWRLWSVTTWKEQGRIDWSDEDPWGAFSRDGRYLAAADWEGVVRVRDLTTGREAASLSANHQAVFGVGFSPDGKTLAAGCGDGTVRVWNIATWRPTITLRTGGSGVCYVGFSPDGRTLAAGCFDHTIRLWHAPALAETVRVQKR